jgi:hypothetical protein
MGKYTFVVMTNPTAGKEDEFNEWYNKQHIPDVLNVPGLVSDRGCANGSRRGQGVQVPGDL